MLNWVGDVKNELNSNEPARDVTTAEILLKSHQDLGDDIRAHQDEFSELSQLGEKLLKRNPDFAEVKEKVRNFFFFFFFFLLLLLINLGGMMILFHCLTGLIMDEINVYEKEKN